MTGTRDARLAEIDRKVLAAGAPVPAGHPLRTAFDHLRHRLGRAHATCEQVDDRAWADYVARLDRGLDELSVELGRADDGPAASAEETLFVHATRLEIDGWQLRLDHARDGATHSTAARELTGRAARELTGYQRGEATRADIDRVMDDVRNTVVA